MEKKMEKQKAEPFASHTGSFDKKRLIKIQNELMSNHIHLVRSEKGELSNVFKSYTSKQILAEIESSTESRKDWMLKLFKDAAFNDQFNSDTKNSDLNTYLVRVVYKNKKHKDSWIDFSKRNPKNIDKIIVWKVRQHISVINNK